MKIASDPKTIVTGDVARIRTATMNLANFLRFLGVSAMSRSLTNHLSGTLPRLDAPWLAGNIWGNNHDPDLARS